MKTTGKTKMLHIAYLGFDGFPLLKSAQSERQKLIAKGLIEAGNRVIIISRSGVASPDASEIPPKSGWHEEIEFHFASGVPFRDKSFLRRNFRKLRGLINEFRMLRRMKKQSGLSHLLVTTNFASDVFLYRLMAWLTGSRLVIDIVEYWQGYTKGSQAGLVNRLSARMLDLQSPRLADEVICISDFLINLSAQYKPRADILKIPAIVNYQAFETMKGNPESYFLYCGSAAYHEVISFVVKAFELSDAPHYQLYLVTHGEPEMMQKVENRIRQSPKSSGIRIFSALPYPELVRLYTNSAGLLIPLRPTEQDMARFPHKIGEYCASARPILSTQIGEVSLYFQHGTNALLASRYEEDLFAEQMTWVARHPQEADRIGQASYILGRDHFDYRQSGRRIHEFLKSNKNIG